LDLVADALHILFYGSLLEPVEILLEHLWGESFCMLLEKAWLDLIFD